MTAVSAFYTNIVEHVDDHVGTISFPQMAEAGLDRLLQLFGLGDYRGFMATVELLVVITTLHSCLAGNSCDAHSSDGCLLI